MSGLSTPWRVPLSSVSVTELEFDAVQAALEEGSLSGTGRAVSSLEAGFARLLGVRAAIATNSGTSALEVLLRALGIGPGDEVIVPAFTFAAPASAVVNAGATPVLCDVDEQTWTLAPTDALRRLTSRTAAILAVDVMGNPCDYERLRELGPTVIEDAAEALGADLEGHSAGSLGDAAVLSLHANKVLSSGEGGVVLTDNLVLAERVRLLVNHGMNAGYQHSVAGHNYRMSNLVAAVATAQLERSAGLISKRIEIERLYVDALDGLPILQQLPQPGGRKATWLVCFRTRERDGLVEALRARGFDARPVWPSLADQPFLREFAARVPVSRELSAECFWLPTFHDLGAESIGLIADAVREFLS